MVTSTATTVDHESFLAHYGEARGSYRKVKAASGA